VDRDAAERRLVRATRAYTVVRAFQTGVAALDGRADIVIKVDADVSVDPDYFDASSRPSTPTRSSASRAVVLRADAGRVAQRHVTGDPRVGASRAYRLACWNDVSPPRGAPRLGRHRRDEGDAARLGARATFTDLPFRHHRREGEREGARLHAWKTTGDAAHYLGYRPEYLVLRSLNSARRDPAAVAMMAGYVSAAVRRKPRHRRRRGRRVRPRAAVAAPAPAAHARTLGRRTA